MPIEVKLKNTEKLKRALKVCLYGGGVCLPGGGVCLLGWSALMGGLPKYVFGGLLKYVFRVCLNIHLGRRPKYVFRQTPKYIFRKTLNMQTPSHSHCRQNDRCL